jgi:pimeloyl-ACP methyl ester carboxylesterase
MTGVEERRLRLWQGKVETAVEVSGSGPPLVYLHGPWGLRGDRDFVVRLAERNTVYAPRHPGTTPGDSEAAHQIDNFWDLIVYYGELFDRLSLATAPVLVGHSFGGLVAAEIAAMSPKTARKLVLIDPVGLWRDDKPVKNWMIMAEAERASALFADPAGDAASRFFALPNEPQARIDAQVEFIWAQACTGKYIWPIPDKGLKRHIHRISAPTLIVWGKEDGVAAAVYAQEFATRIAGSRVELIDRAGHLPQLEPADAVARAVRGFLEV